MPPTSTDFHFTAVLPLGTQIPNSTYSLLFFRLNLSTYLQHHHAALDVRRQNGHCGLSTQQSPLILVDHTASSNQVLNNFLFLSNSIFLSLVFGCVLWVLETEQSYLSVLEKLISQGDFKCCMKFWTESCQIVKQSSLFQANSVQLNSLNRAFPTPLVKIMPSEAEFYHEMSEHVCTR